MKINIKTQDEALKYIKKKMPSWGMIIPSDVLDNLYYYISHITPEMWKNEKHKLINEIQELCNAENDGEWWLEEKHYEHIKAKHSKQELKEIQQTGQKIQKITSYKNDFLKLFNCYSYHNQIMGEMVYHVFLSIICRINNVKVRLLSEEKRCPLTHFFAVQDSGCLPGFSKIQTIDGDKKIKDCNEIEKLLTYNFKTKQQEYCNAIKIDSGIKKIKKITLTDGRICYASNEHTFFVKSKNDEVIEKKLKDISTNDELLCDYKFSKECRQKMSKSKKGKKKNEETKKKMSIAFKGRQVSEETKKILSKNAKLRWQNKEWVSKETKNRRELVFNGSYKERWKNGNPKKGTIYEDYFSKEKTEEIKQKQCEYSLKNNPMYKKDIRKKHLKIMKKLHKEGKIPYFKKGRDNISFGIPRYPAKIYNKKLNLYFRSSWEEIVALKLDENNILFEYEKKRFEFIFENKLTTYTPDFILANKVILEVKGPVFDKVVQKLKIFKKTYSDYKIYLIIKKYNKKYHKKFDFVDIILELNNDNWIEDLKNEIC